jgi:hypothetical protein
MQTHTTKRTIPANQQECYERLYGDDWDIGRYCLVGVLKTDGDAKALGILIFLQSQEFLYLMTTAN